MEVSVISFEMCDGGQERRGEKGAAGRSWQLRLGEV